MIKIEYEIFRQDPDSIIFTVIIINFKYSKNIISNMPKLSITGLKWSGKRICLICNKTFSSTRALKEHYRKTGHGIV